MEPLLDILNEAGQAVLGLFALPYLYIAIAMVWWHARLGVTLQRRLFHVRLYGTLHLTLNRVFAGIIAGAVLSLIGLGVGAAFNAETLLMIWIAMAVLALFRLRYICLAYAAGAIGIVQLVLEWSGIDASQSVFAEAVKTLSAIDVPGLLFLAGLLHVAEGFLVRMQGAKLAIPLFLLGKRGKPMGAFALSGVWPIPLIWLIPATSGGISLPWTPLFGIDGDVATWSLLAFPVLIGFSDRTKAYFPEEKARVSGNLLMLYGVIVAALAAGAEFFSPLLVVAAIAAFLLHEGLVLFSRWRENGRRPLFSQDNNGIKVLAVLPHTPAAEMGFQSGEVIKKVNGAAVHTKEQLHAALQLQSAFCKLEVINRAGHIKFVQRARYEGEHYQLGLIIAPDEDVEFVAAPRSASIWQGLQQAGARRFGRRARSLADDHSGVELAAATEVIDAEPVPATPPVDPGLPPRAPQPRKKP